MQVVEEVMNYRAFSHQHPPRISSCQETLTSWDLQRQAWSEMSQLPKLAVPKQSKAQVGRSLMDTAAEAKATVKARMAAVARIFGSRWQRGSEEG